MSTALVSAAEISNLFSVLTILLALTVMVVFILRLHGEDMFTSAVVRPNRTPQPVNMVVVQNPFVLRLEKVSQCSLEGVYCIVSSQLPFTLQAFWGVSISDLHKILTIDKTIFKNLFYEDCLLDGSVLAKGVQHCFSQCNNQEQYLQPSCDLKSELGNPPRTRYPLVIIMIRTEIDEHETDIQANVFAMISVIHIKDEVCKMESSVLMQYLKQTSGQISCLQPLYVAHEDSNSTSSDTDRICVVCQSEAVTRALLPCRHACVCANCFSHIDKCPMCRSSIQSYFCIKDEPERVAETEINLDELNWRQKLEVFMVRLNNYLGFN